MTSKLAMLFAACALLVISGLGYGQDGLPLGDGDVAPGFTVQALKDGQAGEMVSLSDHMGKIVVIDFFATWCPPCNNAAPAFEQHVWQVYKDRGMVMWGIDVDTSESFGQLQSFADKHGATYPFAMDVRHQAWPNYRNASGSIPTLYIIDKDGIVRLAEVGFGGGTIDMVTAKIEELLGQEPAGPTFELRLNKMDMTPYMPGDIMTLYADVTNPGAPVAVNIFIAVELFGQYYFWPTYDAMATPTPFTLPDGMMMLGYVLESVPFNDTFPHGTFRWFGVLANPLNGEWITDPSVVTWSFGVETP